MNVKHLQTDSSIYWSWINMRRRCYNPTMKSYHNYGGRGIKVCERWLTSFVAFMEDMGPKPKGFLLDRINNFGDYAPENCRWASAKLSGQNRRTVATVIYDGVPMTIQEAAIKLGRTSCGVWRHLKMHPDLASKAHLIKMRKSPSRK